MRQCFPSTPLYLRSGKARIILVYWYSSGRKNKDRFTCLLIINNIIYEWTVLILSYRVVTSQIFGTKEQRKTIGKHQQNARQTARKVLIVGKTDHPIILQLSRIRRIQHRNRRNHGRVYRGHHRNSNSNSLPGLRHPVTLHSSRLRTVRGPSAPVLGGKLSCTTKKAHHSSRPLASSRSAFSQGGIPDQNRTEPQGCFKTLVPFVPCGGALTCAVRSCGSPGCDAFAHLVDDDVPCGFYIGLAGGF